MQFLMQHYQEIIAFLASIVGVASAVSAAIRAFAKVTPNTADDKFAGKVKQFVGRLQKILDRLAMNPDNASARKGQKG